MFARTRKKVKTQLNIRDTDSKETPSDNEYGHTAIREIDDSLYRHEENPYRCLTFPRMTVRTLTLFLRRTPCAPWPPTPSCA